MFKTLSKADLKGKTVLVRADFNVIGDEGKIRATLPTIEYLLKNNCRVILLSHLGRPKGKVIEELRLGAVAKTLSKLLKKDVKKLNESVGAKVKKAVDGMKDRDIILLENVQFHPGERENDEHYAKALASLADIFVLDAFGQSHRNYASLTKIQKFLPSYAGLLLEKEVETLNKLMKNPQKPFIAVLGGAKVSDKIQLIENLLKKVDKLLIGGAMTFTFLKAKGYEIGDSKVESDFVGQAKKLLKSSKILLAVDVVIADKFDAKAAKKTVSVDKIEKGWMGLDIGPNTVKMYKKELAKAKTIVWNGPLGVFEFPRFSSGTVEIAKFIAKSHALTVIGGGDTIAAAKTADVTGKFSHTSTGGGAMLEFLEGKKLPAIEALER